MPDMREHLASIADLQRWWDWCEKRDRAPVGESGTQTDQAHRHPRRDRVTDFLVALVWGGLGMFLATHVVADPAPIALGFLLGVIAMKVVERL